MQVCHRTQRDARLEFARTFTQAGLQCACDKGSCTIVTKASTPVPYQCSGRKCVWAHSKQTCRQNVGGLVKLATSVRSVRSALEVDVFLFVLHLCVWVSNAGCARSPTHA